MNHHFRISLVILLVPYLSTAKENHFVKVVEVSFQEGWSLDHHVKYNRVSKLTISDEKARLDPYAEGSSIQLYRMIDLTKSLIIGIVQPDIKVYFPTPMLKKYSFFRFPEGPACPEKTIAVKSVDLEVNPHGKGHDFAGYTTKKYEVSAKIILSDGHDQQFKINGSIHIVEAEKLERFAQDTIRTFSKSYGNSLSTLPFFEWSEFPSLLKLECVSAPEDYEKVSNIFAAKLKSLPGIIFGRDMTYQGVNFSKGMMKISVNRIEETAVPNTYLEVPTDYKDGSVKN